MVGIIILNYNNAQETLACLDSLREHCSGGNWKVCIVDNASRVEDLDTLKRECGERLIVAKANGGYAQGNNIGLQFFAEDNDVDAVLILNNDTRFTCDIITPLYSYLKEHSECGVVFPLVLSPSRQIDRACWRRQKSTADLIEQATSLGRLRRLPLFRTLPLFHEHRGEFLSVEDIPDENAVRTEVPPGSCMMLPKETFKSVGYFDPNTFLYFEEHILGKKLEKAGKTCVLMPRISIIHLGAQTTKSQRTRTLYRHWRDSYLYFMKEYTETPAVIRRLLQFRTWIKTLHLARTTPPFFRRGSGVNIPKCPHRQRNGHR